MDSGDHGSVIRPEEIGVPVGSPREAAHSLTRALTPMPLPRSRKASAARPSQDLPLAFPVKPSGTRYPPPPLAAPLGLF